ncbi:hypothetical protein KBTX_01911 [wastewater metagenome]|uniref:Peptidoglycan-binding protein CsiV n=2 Tax=unclassified sequences TaxID=12908 RepID=A0A5B8RCF7_9ZZZZ|nr:CsiV family protein [Arhodomonas sp. KWT]QEA05588.1 hypothetical protein KBTEX_01911 [uncultured organism]
MIVENAMPRRIAVAATAVVLALSGLAVSGAALARDYAVEVVVFRQWEASGADGESWPDVPPALPQDVRVSRPGGGPFRRLASSAYQLSGIRQRLASADQYVVLGHFGWIQPDLAKGRNQWVAVGDGVPAGERIPETPGLYGMMRVYVSRYLHAQVDLRYRRETGGTVYPMTQSRRMRSDEIHYLDHPLLGVIVQARPLGDGDG